MYVSMYESLICFISSTFLLSNLVPFLWYIEPV
jgi:hypothetical protein